MPAVAPKPHSSESPGLVPSEPHSFRLSDHESHHPGRANSCSPSLPLSREEASRIRRNGLILILASFGFVTMVIILTKLGEGTEVGAFPKDDLGTALACLGSLGWIVTSTLGCLWRVRGLGQHAAWAIVAPLSGVNLVVVEALYNRYEPQSDLRILRVALAVGGLTVWGIALSQIIKHLWGL
jgi:hypothetical protein